LSTKLDSLASENQQRRSRWVTGMSAQDMYHWMERASLVGGLLAVAWVYRILWNRDHGRFED
ncbi:MAG: hypothetical protein NTW86_24400, partial [Candidatus Sumerlaeota bacterium]|nr:hypothetical protein [Candidatus Sumerlaeota bacterium]